MKNGSPQKYLSTGVSIHISRERQLLFIAKEKTYSCKPEANRLETDPGIYSCLPASPFCT